MLVWVKSELGVLYFLALPQKVTKRLVLGNSTTHLTNDAKISKLAALRQLKFFTLSYRCGSQSEISLGTGFYFSFSAKEK
jgi:hypothetical protein